VGKNGGVLIRIHLRLAIPKMLEANPRLYQLDKVKHSRDDVFTTRFSRKEIGA